MTGKDVIERIIVDLERLKGGIKDMEEMKEVIEEMKQFVKEEENIKKKDEMNTTTTPGIQLEEDNMIIENDSSSIQCCSHHKFSPLCFFFISCLFIDFRNNFKCIPYSLICQAQEETSFQFTVFKEKEIVCTECNSLYLIVRLLF